MQVDLVHLLDRLHHQGQQVHHRAQEQEDDLLRLLDAEPDEGEGHEGGDGKEAQGIEDGGEEGLDGREGAHQEPERDRHNRREDEAHGDAVEAPQGAPDQRLLEVQGGERLQDRGGGGQDDRGHDPAVAEHAPQAEEGGHAGQGQRAHPLVGQLLPDVHRWPSATEHTEITEYRV